VPEFSRRRLLAACAAVSVGACTSGRSSHPRPEPSDPDTLARAAAARAEQAIAEAYDVALASATIVATPALAARLTPLRDHHRAHVDVLVEPTSPSPTPTSATPSASPSATGAASTPEAIVHALAAQERSLHVQLTAALPRVSAELALLLASLGAAAAAHVAELSRR
jgi:hypothetical protein